MQQRSHRRADEEFQQPALGGRVAEGGGQADQVLRLRRKRPLPRRQHPRHPDLLRTGALGGRRLRQFRQGAGVAVVVAGEVGPQQLDRLGVPAAGRRDRVQGRVVAADAETGQQGAGAVGVESRQRDQPGVTAVGQRRQIEARGQDHDAGQRFGRQFLQQPAELWVEEPALPGAVVVLRHLGAVEDQRPAFAAQDRQQMIDAVAGRCVGGVAESGGVGV